MALRIATNQTTLATTYTLGALDGLYVPVGVSSLSSEDVGAFADGSGHKVVVSGSLFGATGGIRLGSAVTDSGNTVLVNASGNVESFGTGIALKASNGRVVNYGTISGARGIDAASPLSASARISIANYGRISGDLAIGSDAGTTFISNFGTIASLSVTAIYTDVGNDVLRNRGSIVGDVNLWKGDDLLINRGTITGIVSMQDNNDTVDNRGGTIDGLIDFGAGVDTFKPGSTEETAAGGDGIDTLDFSNSGSVRLALDGSFAATGVALGDTYSGFENVVGSKTGANVLTGDGVANVLTGGDGKDTLSGQAGADTLNGGLGDDILLGGTGDDTLNGGEGIDRLTGGIGKDTMIGGLGADVFIFGPADFSGITSGTADFLGDFNRASGDRIDLALIDAKTATTANEAFTFIGTAAFSGVAGELRYFTYGVGIGGSSERLVLGDTNGDKTADFAIRLSATLDFPSSLLTLSATDFVL